MSVGSWLRLGPLLTGVALLVAGPTSLAGQVAGDTTTVAAAAAVENPGLQLVPPPPVSPRGAFIRSVLLPGWGQAANGSYNRAGFYVLSQSTTVWMVARIRRRLASAREVQSLREIEAEAVLRARGTTDPDSILLLVEGDAAVRSAQNLIDARQQQFEDWLALGIFMTLLSGVDAYVSAHLTNFPQPVELQTSVLGSGAVEVGLRVPVGGRRRR